MQDLVVADDSPVDAADLDTIPFLAADEGHAKEERAAARLRRLNPDVGIRVLGTSISDARGVAQALRALVTTTELSGADDDSDSDVGEHNVDDERVALDLVVLCVRDGELALRLNDLCCQLGVPFALVLVGVDGISGESLLVVPGLSSCLQCLEKRKAWKAPPAAAVGSDACSEDDGSGQGGESHTRRRAVGPVLPSTDCILAGLCVQNALMCVAPRAQQSVSLYLSVANVALRQASAVLRRGLLAHRVRRLPRGPRALRACPSGRALPQPALPAAAPLARRQAQLLSVELDF